MDQNKERKRGEEVMSTEFMVTQKIRSVRNCVTTYNTWDPKRQGVAGV